MVVLCCGRVPIFRLVAEPRGNLLTMRLFTEQGSEVHFAGLEFGILRERYLFELQNVVEWKMVMSRGPDELAQLHLMSYLLSMCQGMSNRELIDDGDAWVQQGNEEEQRDRAAGVKALLSMVATTTSCRAKEFVK